MTTNPEDLQQLGGESESIEFELPPVSAPTMPLERTLNNSRTFYQRTIGGGMLLKFVPLVATPHGVVPTPEAYVVVFDADSWRHFQREVEAGQELQRVETVRHFPGGMLNGGERG